MTWRVTVLTGGTTPERNVALAGAGQVAEALRSQGHPVRVVDTTRGELDRAEEAAALASHVAITPPTESELAALQSQELGTRLLSLPAIQSADIVFLVLHGREGEGGAMQTLLERGDVLYTGSDPEGSAAAMEKETAKRRFRDAGIPTPDWTVWPATAEHVDQLGWPLVVKPSRVGSTMGLTLVDRPTQLDAAVAHASTFDQCVMLEQFVCGRELTVGVLDSQPLGVGEIIPEGKIFDYESKYTPGRCREVFPADVSDALADRLRHLAREVHLALKLRDFSRIDFRLGADGTPYCLEANTLPGLTQTSLLPQSAAAADIGFEELCQRICEAAWARRSREQSATLGE